jgi:hypothetical protein
MVSVLTGNSVGAVALVLVVAVALCACGDPRATTNTGGDATKKSEPPEKASAEIAPAGGQPSLTIWVVDPLTRVQPTDPPQATRTASIKAARHEYEAFQVVIRAPDETALQNVMVTVSDLVGPGVIPAGRVALYREHYVQVTRPSPGSPYKPGTWPDALIPFAHPETRQALGGRFPAAPFPVAAGRNQPVWVEVYVPPDAQPGSYVGELTVSADGSPPAAIPVRLGVWSFTLPEVPSLQSWFGQLDVADREAPREASRQHLHELLRHRVSPSYAGGDPIVKEDGSIDTSQSHAALAEFLSKATTWTIPFRAEGHPFPDPFGADRARTQRYLRNVQEYLREHGWLDRGFVYVYDEPDDSKKMRVAQQAGHLVRESAPDLRTLVTTAIRTELVDIVRLWVLPFDRYDLGATRRRRARGDEVWSYTAGVRGKGYPTWQLDYPLFHYRMPAWINWSVGATGLLYWANNYWADSSDPWTDPRTYGTLNGDGALVYPGSAVGYHGPVVSMRLKAIRDGIEDYDTLKLLERADRPAAAAAAKRVGSGFRQWTRNPTDILAAREEIGERLHALNSQPPLPSQPGVRR